MSLNITNKPIVGATKAWAEKVLANWRVMNSALGVCTIVDVRTLIVHELRTKRRMALLERLVARYSRLEARENEAEIFTLLAEEVKEE
jgi:hypothetical protein